MIQPMLGQWQIPSIERIQSVERRRLSRWSVPGLAGDLCQDLGAHSLCVEIAGSLSGDQARDDFLTELRAAFAAGEPVSFAADITTATELSLVLIEHLAVEEVADAARPVRYLLRLREYVEPPPPPAPFDLLGDLPDLDAELDLLAELGLDALELPDLLVDLPQLSNPLPPLEGSLDAVGDAAGGLPGLLASLRGALEG